MGVSVKKVQIRVVVGKGSGISLFGPGGIAEKVVLATTKSVNTNRDGDDAVIITGEKITESDVDKINKIKGLTASLVEPTIDPMGAAAELAAATFPFHNDKGE